jgi:hypothetical protein
MIIVLQHYYLVQQTICGARIDDTIGTCVVVPIVVTALHLISDSLVDASIAVLPVPSRDAQHPSSSLPAPSRTAAHEVCWLSSTQRPTRCHNQQHVYNPEKGDSRYIDQ